MDPFHLLTTVRFVPEFCRRAILIDSIKCEMAAICAACALRMTASTDVIYFFPFVSTANVVYEPAYKQMNVHARLGHPVESGVCDAYIKCHILCSVQQALAVQGWI